MIICNNIFLLNWVVDLKIKCRIRLNEWNKYTWQIIYLAQLMCYLIFYLIRTKIWSNKYYFIISYAVAILFAEYWTQIHK